MVTPGSVSDHGRPESFCWTAGKALVVFLRSPSLHKGSSPWTFCCDSARKWVVQQPPIHQEGLVTPLKVLPRPIPGTLQMLIYINFEGLPSGYNHYPHCTDEEAEAQNGSVISPKSHCQEVMEPEQNQAV